MPDLSAIQPVAAIIAAIITATVASLVTYFIVVNRKAVTFWVSKSEDITLPVKKQHGSIVFKIGERELSNINRARVTAKNTGNTVVKDFEFDIEMPGEHTLYLSDTVTKNKKLVGAIQIVEVAGALPVDPSCHVELAYFNPKEVFEIVLFLMATQKTATRLVGLRAFERK